LSSSIHRLPRGTYISFVCLLDEMFLNELENGQQ
jgi:hypothetical protein